MVHTPASLAHELNAEAGTRAHEADGAIAFTVSLSRAASGEVKVDYATRDGTAKAGEDYTRRRGTLTFAAGDLEKTVSVPLLDDAIDEGEETFTLKLMLMNARGAAIGDGEATGTIVNSDPLQKMWISRFGRTVADHLTGAVSDRLAGPLEGAQVTVDGQTLDLTRRQDETWLGDTMLSAARLLGASEERRPKTTAGRVGVLAAGSRHRSPAPPHSRSRAASSCSGARSSSAPRATGPVRALQPGAG